MDQYVARWLDNPDDGGLFTRQRDLIRTHGPCVSVEHAWLPRRGGVSCLSDSMTCDGCGIDFFWEGLHQVFEECPESDHWMCACCRDTATACGCE